jgi:shikimate kinase
VAEVIGPAGAGKSTLLRALSQREKRILPDIRLPKRVSIPILIRDTTTFLPTFLRYYRHSRWFTWRETRSMVYLSGWHQVLKHRAPRNDSVTVLDQGPIFRLALLREFGPELTHGDVYIKWWNNMLNQWAATLQLVIWLDAPDAVLFQRVNSRTELHRVKGQPEQDAYQYFGRYRTSYQQVIERMKAIQGPRLLCVNTHQTPVDRIVDRVLDALDF